MLNVLFLQLPVPNNPAANIALAAGYLKAWAYQQGLLEHITIEIMPRRISDHAGDALLVHEIVARQPDMLAMSLYTWNSERSLVIAELVKQHLPELIVIVGGPEIQRNNEWILRHPAVDLAVEGEGEQTFCEILQFLYSHRESVEGGLRAKSKFPLIAGTIQCVNNELIFAPPRASLEPLDQISSPYELGFLELNLGDMALIECSRWCPYGCTFCLYGRNMGAKLGGRMFSSERVLAEVAWAKQHGAGAIHFVEANLNLLPSFRELMAGLHELNTDRSLPIYAELRGEHLKSETVQMLVDAGLRVAEVGLQSANRNALQAVGRRTDLDKWADGTRRLYEHGVEVLLDVILGLPEDDETSTLATLDWIAAQQLGDYDIFTLQVLPGTGIRNDAERFAMTYQDRPPYYVLSTHKLSYSQLRGLRWELRAAAGLDPLAVEGLPQPSADVWQHYLRTEELGLRINVFGEPIHTLMLDCAADMTLEQWRELGKNHADHVASHVIVIAQNSSLNVIEAFCDPIAHANPTIHWDIICDDPTLDPQAIRAVSQRWHHRIGYLDRVAVYRRIVPEPAWFQITPRWWIVVDWRESLDPLRFEAIADVVWRVDHDDFDQAIANIMQRGGSGVVVAGELNDQQRTMIEQTGLRTFGVSV